MNLIYVHKHYVGSAHSFEIVTNTGDIAGEYIRPDVTILKTFFINDKVNINDWQVTWEGLKEDAKELVGTPLVLQEDLQHPKFSVQELFDRGTIFDYDIDEENKQIIVYVRITDASVAKRIKSGELQYVSPSVIPRGSEHLRKVNGIEVMDRILPLHLAIVGDPAYGKDKAKMSHLCSGDGKECYHRLKIMTASSAIYKAATNLQDCVSRKIKMVKNKKPEISNGQAAAIAYSMCREKNADGNTGIKSNLKEFESEITSLEQIPLIKKMIASTNRLISTYNKIRTTSKLFQHEDKQGRWIVTKGMDVFVAENQTINNAIKTQCGCTVLTASAAKGKISQQRANYHKTDSEDINCYNCRFYHKDTKYCEVVSGMIEPYYVSDLFQPK